jgi:nitrous oxidase accessory protein NosD
MKTKLMTTIVIVLFLVSVIVTVVPLQGAVTTYYVGPTGKDTNIGSKASPWLTIQHAVDTVPSGAVINVAAGTYVEQVVISKALTLSGTDAKTIIRPGTSTLVQVYAMDGGTWSSYNLAGIIIVKNVAVGTVKISNLQVDGKNVNVPSGYSSCYPVGVVYGESSGTVQNVKVVNMNTTTYVARSYGIWLNAFSTTVSDTITGCTVVGYYRNGIMTSGDMLTFDIDNNKVTGPGTSGPDQLPNGIVLADGSIGTVSDNTITKNHYNGGPGSPPANPWLSEAIMGWNEQPGVSIDNNVLSDNDVGIAPTSGDYISNNLICSNSYFGIELEAGAADNIIVNNVIRNNYYGIHLLGSGSPWYTGSGDEPGTGSIAFWNNIYKNTVGVQNWDTTQTFRAKYNWWGDCSGPYNSALNPSGKGNSVSSYVDFTPWAKKAY